MLAHFHRTLMWAFTGLAAFTFLVVFAAYAGGSPLSLGGVVVPLYVLLALGLLALTILRPRSGSTLPVGVDRARWRIVLVCAALTASGFLLLFVFPPANLLPWASLGAVAMAIILVVAILAILFPPREEEEPIVRVAVQAPLAPAPAHVPTRTWAVIYATSSGVAIADGTRAPPPLDDYFVTQGGRRVPLAEVERIIDKALPPATARPTDAELLSALRRWGEIVEVPP